MNERETATATTTISQIIGNGENRNCSGFVAKWLNEMGVEPAKSIQR